MHDPSPDPHTLESRTSLVLISGTLVAAAVAAIGSLLLLSRAWHDPAGFGRYHPTPDSLRRFSPLLARAADLDPPAIMQVGVILLILTPVLRVGFTLSAFLRRRDRVWVAINVFVLAVLIYGVAGGRV